jgi:hypothetical protein
LDRINQLYKDFPFDVLLSVLFVVVFYLMQRLYATNLSVLRNYLYLGALENEIRERLLLTEEKVFFTREGKFYWTRRSFTQTMSKWYYILVVAIVLFPSLILKLIDDFCSSNTLIMMADIVVAFMISIFFIEYARSAIKLDISHLPISTPTEKNLN